MFCQADTELWIKAQKYGKVKVTHQVIHKGHQFVESTLLLLKRHKKCENDMTARFCCSDDKSQRQKKQKN